MIKKPPLYVMPQYIWNQKRIDDLLTAIGQFIEISYPIPIELIEEYNELVIKLKNKKEK
ncbi:hypothetical protein [Paenibacillus dendritiformis]|uniref:hypothetical protein n=1 Tax=Paenibacillus dendritiformis TaxID=130049 RepID=UPI00387E0B28